MEKQLTAVLIVAGNRGQAYTNQMLKYPEKFKLVAVADPEVSRLEYIQEKHNIPADRCFTHWSSLLSLGKIADVAIICTMDKDHLEPAMAAISLHYDLLLEKPVTPDPKTCEMLAQHAEKNQARVLVCHVLRYTPFFITIKDLISKMFWAMSSPLITKNV